MNICWNKQLNSFCLCLQLSARDQKQITREQISTKSWFHKKANNHKQQYPSWDLQSCGPQCTGGFPWCSAKHMEQRGHAWRLLQCSHCYSLQQQGEQVQLWKLQRHLTSFHRRNDLYSHSPEPNDHGNWKRSPRGAVWLQTRVQHHGHDFVIRQVQENWTEQGPLLCLYKINLTKVFNTVNREALWMVLERYGCPKKFVRLIQLPHDGMTGQLSSLHQWPVSCLHHRKWNKTGLHPSPSPV